MYYTHTAEAELKFTANANTKWKAIQQMPQYEPFLNKMTQHILALSCACLHMRFSTKCRGDASDFGIISTACATKLRKRFHKVKKNPQPTPIDEYVHRCVQFVDKYIEDGHPEKLHRWLQQRELDQQQQQTNDENNNTGNAVAADRSNSHNAAAAEDDNKNTNDSDGSSNQDAENDDVDVSEAEEEEDDDDYDDDAAERKDDPQLVRGMARLSGVGLRTRHTTAEHPYAVLVCDRGRTGRGKVRVILTTPLSSIAKNKVPLNWYFHRPVDREFTKQQRTFAELKKRNCLMMFEVDESLLDREARSSKRRRTKAGQQLARQKAAARQKAKRRSASRRKSSKTTANSAKQAALSSRSRLQRRRNVNKS